MKGKTILIFATILALGWHCKDGKPRGKGKTAKPREKISTRTLTRQETINDTTFAPGTAIKVSDKRGLLEATLGANQKAAGKRFVKAFPHVFQAGTVLDYRAPFKMSIQDMPRIIKLKSEHVIFGIKLPAGSQLNPAAFVYKVDGKVTTQVKYIQIRLGGDVKIKGRTLKRFSHFNLYSRKKIMLLQKGKLVPL